jgi:hypothetical protein
MKSLTNMTVVKRVALIFLALVITDLANAAFFGNEKKKKAEATKQNLSFFKTFSVNKVRTSFSYNGQSSFSTPTQNVSFVRYERNNTTYIQTFKLKPGQQPATSPGLALPLPSFKKIFKNK